MPVVHVGPSSPATKMTSSGYSDEDELQTLLAEHPYLLMDDGEPELSLVGKEVVLPGAGRLDLLLVDDAGRPTVVEVKLRRNGESRREVLAQVFDYVSSLAEMTVRELDRLVAGNLGNALRSFSTETDEDDAGGFQARWGSCADALRAGNVRVVVAIDSAPPELVRIVRFVNDHSDLDVRLVEVGRYRDAAGGSILVPKLLVVAGEAKAVERAGRASPSNEFVATVNTYNDICATGFKATGRASNYRPIRPPTWPKSLHYEFMDAKRFGIEIHVEGAKTRPIADTLRNLALELSDSFPNAEVLFDPKWSKHRGRLRVLMPKDQGHKAAADAMVRLISLTHDRISSEVAKL